MNILSSLAKVNDYTHMVLEVVALSVGPDVLQADKSLTFLRLPDDRTEILELLV
jgi:hypothetical protein